MLETLDLLIGFVVVMLVVSMAVTLLTQLLGDLLNLRGQALRTGLAELLLIIDRPAMKDVAGKIADHILRDPLISRSPMIPPSRVPGGLRRFLGNARLGPVIQREELTRLLLVFAAPAAYPQETRSAAMTTAELDTMRAAFALCLQTNGIATPAQLLETIRAKALELERTQPALSNSERANAAILTFGVNDFVGKINGWFDQTIDRVRDQFALSTRALTVIAAAVVALFLQLDALGLINRLSNDPETTKALVTWAIDHQVELEAAVKASAAEEASDETAGEAAGEKTGETTGEKTGETAASDQAAPPPEGETAGPAPEGAAAGTDAGTGTAAADASAAAPAATPEKKGEDAASEADATSSATTAGSGAAPAAKLTDFQKAALAELTSRDLIYVPTDIGVWWARWQDPKDRPKDAKLVGLPRVSFWGVLLSALLLSLGAPFWYEALKNLLKMRSVLIGKDDAQRKDRQTHSPQTDPAAPPATSPAPPSGAGGEQGDLTALG